MIDVSLPENVREIVWSSDLQEAQLLARKRKQPVLIDISKDP